MKTYVRTTGVVFGLITVAHLLRIVAEWPHLATEPLYLLLTAATAGLCLWSWRLLRVEAR